LVEAPSLSKKERGTNQSYLFFFYVSTRNGREPKIHQQGKGGVRLGHITPAIPLVEGGKKKRKKKKRKGRWFLSSAAGSVGLAGGGGKKKKKKAGIDGRGIDTGPLFCRKGEGKKKNSRKMAFERRETVVFCSEGEREKKRAGSTRSPLRSPAQRKHKARKGRGRKAFRGAQLVLPSVGAGERKKKRTWGCRGSPPPVIPMGKKRAKAHKKERANGDFFRGAARKGEREKKGKKGIQERWRRKVGVGGRREKRTRSILIERCSRGRGEKKKKSDLSAATCRFCKGKNVLGRGGGDPQLLCRHRARKREGEKLAHVPGEGKTQRTAPKRKECPVHIYHL